MRIRYESSDADEELFTELLDRAHERECHEILEATGTDRKRRKANKMFAGDSHHFFGRSEDSEG